MIRTPPDLLAEEKLVACVLRDPEVIPRAGVASKHIQDRWLSLIWSWAEDAYGAGDADGGGERFRTALAARARSAGYEHIDELWLGDIEGSVGTAENVEYYAEVVRQEWITRQVVAHGQRAAAPNGERGDKHLARILSGLLDVQAESASHASPAGMSELVRRVIDDARKQCVSGLSTGFPELDDSIHGIQRGVLTDVGAWTSYGKSTLALCMALHAARAGHSTDVYSLEDVGVSVARRLLAMIARVRTSVLMTGRLTEYEWQQVDAARDELQALPIRVYDHTSTCATELCIEAKRNATANRTELIVVDYVQLLHEPGAGSRNDEMTSISRRLKQLAKETKCGLVRCSQLRRPDTGLKNQIPSVHHLRDSGSLEQDSHAILLINKSQDDGVREIIIGKNKDGPTGVVKLRWDGRIPMFRSMQNERADG